MSETLTARVTVVLSLVLIGGWSIFHSAPGPLIPPRVPISQAQAWMVDTIPGIGEKTKEQIAAQLRAGNLEAVPARGRLVAEQIFDVSGTKPPILKQMNR